MKNHPHPQIRAIPGLGSSIWTRIYSTKC
ncbi:hypothetical protein LINGRAHAP2_LOCUS33031 [Linum grandiflorum]